MVLGYDANITFNSQIFMLKNVNKHKVPGTLKQKIGKRLVKHDIPNRTVQDLEITGNGIIYDTSTAATTTRAAIEALYDLEPYSYSDGLITATMIMEDLSFNDNSENPLHFEYTIKFIQFQQVD